MTRKQRDVRRAAAAAKRGETSTGERGGPHTHRNMLKVEGSETTTLHQSRKNSTRFDQRLWNQSLPILEKYKQQIFDVFCRMEWMFDIEVRRRAQQQRGWWVVVRTRRSCSRALLTLRRGWMAPSLPPIQNGRRAASLGGWWDEPMGRKRGILDE